MQIFQTIEAIARDISIFPAHIRIIDGAYHVQTVDEHLERTAEYARDSLANIGLGNTAYICGLLHDIGKRSFHYKEYLIKIARGDDANRGSVNHTFAGVRYILEEFHSSKDNFIRLTAELIAYAVGAHHGEFDCLSTDGEFGFDYRCTKNDSDIDEALRHFRNDSVCDKINACFTIAVDEIKNFLRPSKAFHFESGLLARLLLSAVIEGDRRDTSEFMNNLKMTEYDRSSILKSALANTEAYISTFARNTQIQKCRGEISDLCAKYAVKLGNTRGSISRLDIPTGGGKTLSSLRYALNRAVLSGKKHIIYVIPLLSILEQNAGEIRKAVGNDGIVFEHHSNVVSPDDCEELQKCELLSDTWDSPILITTLVQFLNTLFSHKTTSIRRFHSLTDSVIILDEVQTVPLKMVSLFNTAMDFLTKYCGAEVILCSATQPAFELAAKPMDEPIQSIISYDEELWKPFSRTMFKYYNTMDTDSISIFAKEISEENNSLLVVCNTKNVAAKLYHNLQNTDATVYYLSTNLCMAHRRNVLENMRMSLAEGIRTLCVSTQVIEAGVDISFKRVIRLLAGLDSLVQAAGRCNRNGECTELSEVSVIRCADESLKMLSDIENGQKAVLRILSDPNTGDALTSSETIQRYYNILYRDDGLSENYQDYYIKDCDDTIYSLLSKNQKSMCKQSAYFLNQAFLYAGKNFNVFDTETEDIAVPYDKGADLISELYSERASHDFLYQKELVEAVKPYTVSIFPYQKEYLFKNGALHRSPIGVLTLSPDWYGEEGLLTEGQTTLLEV